MTQFRLPDLGEGLQEAEIVTWHVSVGDHVTADQPLVSVETDKAVVEVPSPQSGRIKALLAQPGELVSVGAPLVEFLDDAAADSGAIVGELEAEAEAKPAMATSKEAAKSAPLPTMRVRASPAVRRQAERLGVDLDTVAPTGHAGEVTMADVERAAEPIEGEERLRGVRRTMAERMAESHERIVPATITDDADVDVWWGKAEPMLRLVRAIISGCQAEPSLNAWYDGKRRSRRLHEKIDLGVGMDTDDGLFVPVLRDVGRRGQLDITYDLEELKTAVRQRTASPRVFREPTITLSNFGPLGGRYAALVIVPPQVAILGAGRVVSKVVAIDGAPVVHHVMPLSLTFDHRVVTGGEAARFLGAVVNQLESET